MPSLSRIPCLKWSEPLFEVEDFLTEHDFFRLVGITQDISNRISPGSADILMIEKSTYNVFSPGSDWEKVCHPYIDGIDAELSRIEDAYANDLAVVLDIANPLKSRLPFKVRAGIGVTPPGSSYRVHEDSYVKLLSGIVYLSPAICNGTLLYGSFCDRDCEELDWKCNKGVFFSRRRGATWHSYFNNSSEIRFTLILNILFDGPAGAFVKLKILGAETGFLMALCLVLYDALYGWAHSFVKFSSRAFVR